MDFANFQARKVGVFTDPTVRQLLPMKTAIESLEANGVPYEIFDQCRVEPNQESWQQAIDFSKKHDISHFVRPLLTCAIWADGCNSLLLEVEVLSTLPKLPIYTPATLMRNSWTLCESHKMRYITPADLYCQQRSNWKGKTNRQAFATFDCCTYYRWYW